MEREADPPDLMHLQNRKHNDSFTVSKYDFDVTKIGTIVFYGTVHIK